LTVENESAGTVTFFTAIVKATPNCLVYLATTRPSTVGSETS